VFFCNQGVWTGYGENLSVEQLGGMDYQDIMSDSDATLKQNDWIDTTS